MSTQQWTLGRRIGAGFAVMAGLCVVIGGLATFALRAVVDSKDQVITSYSSDLLDVERLKTMIEQKGAAGRGYLLTGDPRFRAEVATARTEFTATVARLRTRGSERTGAALDLIEQAESDHRVAMDRAFSLRTSALTSEPAARAFQEDVVPLRQVLNQRIDAFVSLEQGRLKRANEASTATANAASSWMIGIMLFAALFAVAAAVLVAEALTRQIGSAVQHMQSSSAELQAAASQQSAGSREQAVAMTEITTTINELLATSRQIAESAQRVSHIAEETAEGAGVGDQTVQRAQESILTIKSQVDAIVTHMLDLGRKSQQIGGVLEIINELAEQTNILATNATIEAAGAGENGRRFAVVADEIRKLADRVGGSTKEVRSLIEGIRAAVNAAVMATEGGSKAVDAGARKFSEVANSFKQIADRVGTTTEAAREIELSTRQQATAVEQVNLAVTNVAQASRESETSSSQTLQTATQLTALSRQLAVMVQAKAA